MSLLNETYAHIQYVVNIEKGASPIMVQHTGLNLGRFQTGKFPFMMFGLPAAAMYFSVPKENR